MVEDVGLVHLVREGEELRLASDGVLMASAWVEVEMTSAWVEVFVGRVSITRSHGGR